MKISIIIPVYNSERYICQCLNSIVNQKDIPVNIELEVIMVDDGSTDNSGDICNKYSEKYPNFKVVHQENQGVSVARNVALEHITGDYITFLDSDDVLGNTLIKELDAAEFYNYEELFFGMYIFNGSGIIKKQQIYLSDNKDVEIQRIIQHKSISTVWGTIYKRTLFEDNEIRFEPGIRIGEDWQVAFKLFICANKYKSIKQCLYGYRENNESVTRKRIDYVCPDALIALNEMIRFAEQKGININRKDIAYARSDLRRQMMKNALRNHLFRQNDSAMRKYGNQSFWKDLRYSGSLKHFAGFLVYKIASSIVHSFGIRSF